MGEALQIQAARKCKKATNPGFNVYINKLKSLFEAAISAKQHTK